MPPVVPGVPLEEKQWRTGRSLTLRLCGDKTVRVERPDRHDASGTNEANHFYQQVNALVIGEPVSNTPCIVRL